MSILKKLNNFLTRTVGINILNTTPVTQKRVSGDIDVLPELLASSEDMEIGDRFVKRNSSKDTQPSTEKYSRTHRRASKRSILKRNEISFWKKLLYNVKDIFMDQDIAGQIRREFNLGSCATEKEYIEAAHKHMKKKFEGLTESEALELYKELQNNFALDITRDDDDAELLSAIYAAILGDFAADSRTQMAEDLLEASKSDDMKTATAKKLFDNAEYNMTNPDALGNVPEKESATEYFSCVFENMTKKDIETALDKLAIRADEVEPRIKELLAKETRTAEEEFELQKLQLLHRNIIVSGLGGANIGIMANTFVNASEIPMLLEQAYETAAKHNIENEVNTAIIEYINANPEIKEKIETLRNIDIETYIEEIRTNLLTENEPNNKSLTEDEVSENKANVPEAGDAVEDSEKTDRQIVSKETNTAVTAYVQSTDKNNVPEHSSIVSGAPLRVIKNPAEPVTPAISSNTTIIRSALEAKEYIKNNANGMKDVFTGKIECLTSSAETIIINQYKNLGKEQGAILAECKEKFFKKLKDVTKISSVESYLASGGKGINFDRTEAMNEMVEEYNNKQKDYVNNLT